MTVRPAGATNDRLTRWARQCRISTKRAKRLTAILRDGDPAVELVDPVIAAVQHDVTVLKFNRLALVEPVIRLGADMPGRAMVVTVQYMTVVRLRASLR